MVRIKCKNPRSNVAKGGCCQVRIYIPPGSHLKAHIKNLRLAEINGASQPLGAGLSLGGWFSF